MGTCEELIALAETQVGVTSGKKYWDWYWQGTREYVDGWTTPYCACFDTWLLGNTNTLCPCFPSAVAFDERDDFEGRFVSKYDLQRGDMVAFDWDGDLGGDHVGVVVSVHDWGIVTIEGNTDGGRVVKQQRVWAVVICGVRPWYAEEDDMTHEQMEELSDMIANKLVEVLPRANAEYVYGDADKAENLNMYNQSRWSFEFLKRIAQKLGA